ncbi:MAG: hypothetical protein M3036_04540 [Bifidobacteriales bacterium]|nr:hypothetical protein [Bifidobacteriales bacterium]
MADLMFVAEVGLWIFRLSIVVYGIYAWFYNDLGLGDHYEVVNNDD